MMPPPVHSPRSSARRGWPGAGPRVLLALTVAGLPRIARSTTPSCATVGKGYVDKSTVLFVNGGFVADAAACQQSCLWDPICAFFTYHPKTLDCWKYPPSAADKRVTDPASISGPKTCTTSTSKPPATSTATSTTATLTATTSTTTPPAATAATTAVAEDVVNATKADQGELGAAPVELPAAPGGLPDDNVLKKEAAAGTASQMHWWGWLLIALAAIGIAAVGYHFLGTGGQKGSKKGKRTRGLRLDKAASRVADAQLEADETADSSTPLVAEAAPLPTSFAPVPTYGPVPGLTPPNLAAALGPPNLAAPPPMPQPMMQARQAFAGPPQGMVRPGFVPMPQARLY